MQNKKQTKLVTIILLSIFLAAMFLPLVQSQIKNQPVTMSRDTTNWWNTQWPYRKLITIDHTKVSGNLANFPVLISRDLDADLTAAQPTGQDITFICYTDNSTQFNHEIEYFNSTSGQLLAWVNIPLLSSTTDTNLWMYYGNPSSGNQQHIEATWDADFLAVHHLEETTGTVIDSTVNNNDGTPYGTLNQNIIGKIDGADFFDGIDDRILLPSVYTTENQFTIETWIYAQTGARHFISQRSNTSQGVFIQIIGDNCLQYYINGMSHITGVVLNKWYYVVVAYNGSTARLYVNGFDSEIPAAPPIWPSDPMSLGDRPAGDRQFHGTMDEVRFSDIARTCDWINTVYANQNNSEAFISVGPETPYTYTISLFIDPPCGGTVILSPDPPYQYNDIVSLTAVANPGFTFDHWGGDLTGSQNPTLIVMDEDKSVTASFLINNTPPIALNDSITVLENSTDNMIDVLANDTDPDGDDLKIISITQPSHGNATHDDSFTWYTPEPMYTGSDSFTYTISDGNGGNATATVFITVTPLVTNSPPNIPNHPIPMDGQMNVSITPDLYWSGGDPDPGDTVTYDVYFGTNMTPPLVAANQSTTGYDVGVLNYDTTYYWRIVACDNHNATASGPLWHFTTEQEATEVNVTITRPKEHTFYLRSFKLFSLPRLSLPRTTFIYGPIRITAAATAEEGVDRVEFYIDGKLKHTDKTAPYTYRWAPLRCFKHTITVIAYDIHENIASDEITVFKWRLHPVLLMIGGLLLTN